MRNLFLFFKQSLTNVSIFFLFAAELASAVAMGTEITEIDSVSEISLPFGRHVAVICDDTETMAKVDCMTLNWENSRQFSSEIGGLFNTFKTSLLKERGELKEDFWEDYTHVFQRSLLTYTLTEPGWMDFLSQAREQNSKVIAISSNEISSEELERKKFLEELGFDADHWLHADGSNDIENTLYNWLSNHPEITDIILIDNCRQHCEGIVTSKRLAAYKPKAFVHNAYKNYFETKYKVIVPLQLQNALLSCRSTDDQALAEAANNALSNTTNEKVQKPKRTKSSRKK